MVYTFDMPKAVPWKWSTDLPMLHQLLHCHWTWHPLRWGTTFVGRLQQMKRFMSAMCHLFMLMKRLCKAQGRLKQPKWRILPKHAGFLVQILGSKDLWRLPCFWAASNHSWHLDLARSCWMATTIGNCMCSLASLLQRHFFPQATRTYKFYQLSWDICGLCQVSDAGGFHHVDSGHGSQCHWLEKGSITSSSPRLGKKSMDSWRGGVNSLVFLVAKTLFFHWTEWIHGYGFGNVFDIYCMKK